MSTYTDNYKRQSHASINTAKYLGMMQDAKLRWKAHVTKIREQLRLKIQENVLVRGKKIDPVDTQ
jgi:hypothetical protein